MSKYSEAGKGSKQRPTNRDAYAKNWGLIFGTKKDNTGVTKNEYQDILSTEESIEPDSENPKE